MVKHLSLPNLSVFFQRQMTTLRLSMRKIHTPCPQVSRLLLTMRNFRAHLSSEHLTEMFFQLLGRSLCTSLKVRSLKCSWQKYFLSVNCKIFMASYLWFYDNVAFTDYFASVENEYYFEFRCTYAHTDWCYFKFKSEFAYIVWLFLLELYSLPFTSGD